MAKTPDDEKSREAEARRARIRIVARDGARVDGPTPTDGSAESTPAEPAAARGSERRGPQPTTRSHQGGGQAGQGPRQHPAYVQADHGRRAEATPARTPQEGARGQERREDAGDRLPPQPVHIVLGHQGQGERGTLHPHDRLRVRPLQPGPTDADGDERHLLDRTLRRSALAAPSGCDGNTGGGNRKRRRCRPDSSPGTTPPSSRWRSSGTTSRTTPTLFTAREREQAPPPSSRARRSRRRDPKSPAPSGHP